MGKLKNFFTKIGFFLKSHVVIILIIWNILLTAVMVNNEYRVTDIAKAVGRNYIYSLTSVSNTIALHQNNLDDIILSSGKLEIENHIKIIRDDFKYFNKESRSNYEERLMIKVFGALDKKGAKRGDIYALLEEGVTGNNANMLCQIGFVVKLIMPWCNYNSIVNPYFSSSSRDEILNKYSNEFSFINRFQSTVEEIKFFFTDFVFKDIYASAYLLFWLMIGLIGIARLYFKEIKSKKIEKTPM